MKKRLNVISLLFLLLLFSYCGKEGKQQFEPQGSSAHTALAEIDSLMWRQPDSAFALLLQFVGSPEADGLDTYNGHYCQLLISELLYKNDCEQTNRKDLQKAVTYFDSLTLILNDTPSPKRLIAGKDPLSLTRNGSIAFLDARAHYINGVGYYERDSVVEACKEYLKALEVMEEHFEEKELLGYKAQFMAYIYNRLGDMFEEQLLAEHAIVFYKQALFYCKREPTSIYGISIILYSIGIQFQVSGQIDSAYFYYDKALANIPNNDNIHYRDIMSTKALLTYYNFGLCADSVIKGLKHIISLSADEDERKTRLLTLGNILFDDKQYDSSIFYLETVFEQQEDIPSKIVAAENLCSIFQLKGDSLKVRQYSSFLADFTMAEIEKKKDVSKINEMFKNYLTQKQEKSAEEEREKAIKKVIKIIIPINVIIALVIIVLAKFRSKKILKEQQKTADRILGKTEQQHKEELKQRQAEAEKTLKDKEKHHQQEMEAKEAQAKKELEERDKQHAEVLEAERQTHRIQQAAMSGRLKHKNQEVRELKDKIKQMNDLSSKNETVASFDEEPICRLIMERVHDGQFKAKIDCGIYKSYALDKQQLLDLRMAADRHFSQLTLRLRKAYPKLTSIDIDYCCLYLLNLTHADVSALMQRAYNTVVERDSKIQKVIGSEKPLPITLMDIAHSLSSN